MKRREEKRRKDTLIIEFADKARLKWVEGALAKGHVPPYGSCYDKLFPLSRCGRTREDSYH